MGDVCSQLSDGLHKAPKFKLGGDYIFVNAKNISNGFIVDNDPTKKSTHEEYVKYPSPLDDTSILYSIDGTIGNIALYRGEKVILGKGACYLNPMPNILDRFFLYYELLSPRFKTYIDKMSTGSTIKHISLKTMRNYSFMAPPLQQQKQIASILSSINNKITCNRQINDNLEQQAQALFKSWFVDFEPFKDGEFVESEMGMIPKGWRVRELDGIIEISKQSINPNKSPEILFTHYSIPAYDREKQPDTQLGKEILSNKFVVRDNMTLFSKLNPRIKRIWYVGDILENSICSTEFVPFLAKDSALSVFVFSLVSSQGFYDYILSMVNGATGSHQRFHPEETLSYKIAYNQEIALEYNAIAEPMITQIHKNQQESRRLAQLRDTLLPRLMSGELKVEAGF